MAMKSGRIEVEIGELVLTGFPPEQRHRIGDAVRGELERLLAERGSPDSLRGGGAAERVDAGPVRLPAGASAGLSGRRIAGAVYRGLGR
jgi:hypothetical protein